jgi:hypothetical protein
VTGGERGGRERDTVTGGERGGRERDTVTGGDSGGRERDTVTGGDSAPHERHLVSHIFNIVVFVVGGGALVLLLRQLGLDSARDMLGGIGPWLAVVVGIDVCATACDAAAIHAFMRPEQRMVSYVRVLAAQASGHAINILTPGGALGEATKVAMLVGHMPRARIVSSIVLYNLATLYLSVVVLVIGVPLTTALVDLPRDVELIAWIGLGVVLVLVVVIGVLVHRGAVETLLAGARGTRLVSADRAARWAAKIADIDHQLRALHADTTPGLRAGALWLAASRLCSWAATTTVLAAVGVSITATLLVGIFSVGILVDWVSSIVPLGVGLADGGNYALFGVLGAHGINGIIVTMLGRARRLIIAVLGLVAMAIAHTATRITLHRRRLRLHEGPRYGD